MKSYLLYALVTLGVAFTSCSKAQHIEPQEEGMLSAEDRFTLIGTWEKRHKVTVYNAFILTSVEDDVDWLQVGDTTSVYENSTKRDVKCGSWGGGHCGKENDYFENGKVVGQVLQVRWWTAPACAPKFYYRVEKDHITEQEMTRRIARDY